MNKGHNKTKKPTQKHNLNLKYQQSISLKPKRKPNKNQNSKNVAIKLSLC